MSKSAPTKTDVALIGAGPIGLEMAVGLKQVGLDYLHFEAHQIGHTISWFPRQARFFSSPERIAICGVPLMTVDQSKATREEYLAYLQGVVQQFQLDIRTYERVDELSACQYDAQPGFRLRTTRRGTTCEYLARNVIVSIGDMHGPRTMAHPGLGTVPGAEQAHVSHYFDEPYPYSGQRLLIVGGKNSAVEAAIRCYRAGAQVTLCHRQLQLSDSIKYWLKPEIDWLVQAGEIAQRAGWVPVAIGPDHVELAPVDDQGVPTTDRNRWERVSADFVLLLIGYVMDPSLLRQLGVDLYGPGLIPRVDPLTMQTNVPGVYVAGTAAAGTQLSFKLFIENCHAHVVRILRHLADTDPQHINPLAYARLNEHPIPAES